MQEIPVRTWQELTEALYDIPRASLGRYRSNLVYRGLADADWHLETSLQRLGGAFENLEGPLLRSFRKYAEPGQLPNDSVWVQLAIAQHHGLPTRLMDWTVSPRIAAHFATAEEEHYSKSAAIWCIDVVEARKLLPAELRAILDRESAFLFSFEMLRGISLADFDRYRQEGEFLLFFEPPSLDARIVNQWAVMSVMPGADVDLNSFLEKHPKLVRKIVISEDLKWELRDKLDQDNVTERMLFPGLDGLSQWLKRYYGPGPAGRGPRPPAQPDEDT
jgi:hypothetical protein